MPHHDDKHSRTKAEGEITDVFAHRFVLKTKSKTVLADLTPHGLEIIKLRVGDRISIEGEQKPSEIKVSKLERDGKTFDLIHDEHTPADPAAAIEAATSAGYSVIGEPRRKPKHFEVLGKIGRAYQELHIEPDGEIRKIMLVSSDDHKWHSEIEGARAA